MFGGRNMGGTMKTALTEEKIAELKAWLLARREDLRRELLAEHDQEEDSPGHVVRHGGEEYFDKLLKDVGAEITDLRIQEVRAVDAALQRIANGRYGICLACEEPIDYERLQAFPVAMLCLECKEDAERQAKI